MSLSEADTLLLRTIESMDGPRTEQIAEVIGMPPEVLSDYLERSSRALGLNTDVDGRWWISGNASRVRPGSVSHFKGGRYLVFGTALHTESGERLVVYRTPGPMSVDPAVDFYVRPLEMFVEMVEHQGRTVPRFDDTQLRSQDRPDMLSTVEDVISEGNLNPTSLVAVRALIDAQRGETINLLAANGNSSDAAIRAAVASMLRLLDAAEAEASRAEEALRR